jgi:hypothetical protein
MVYGMPPEHGHLMLLGRPHRSNLRGLTGRVARRQGERYRPDVGMRVDVTDLDGSSDDTGDLLRVRLSGWASTMNMRRTVAVGTEHVTEVSATLRSALEPAIDRKLLGVGSNNGSFRPNRARIGTMLVRGVQGKQFWAVRSSGPELPVLVLDLHGHEFARIVVGVEDPYLMARQIATRLDTGRG